MNNLLSQPRKAALYFLYSYWIVTILGTLLTILFAVLFNPPSPQELGVTASQSPAYLMTIPYHPFLNLGVWPWFAWFYWRALSPMINRKREMFMLGILWAVATILIDLIGWVLIPHPWAMTFKEFYIDYQPWITLVYMIIFGSPVAIVYFQERSNVRLGKAVINR